MACLTLVVSCLFLDPHAVRGLGGPTSKACAWLPTADLEMLYGGKADAPMRAYDNPLSSGCTIRIGNQSAEIQSVSPTAPPSQVTVSQLVKGFEQMNALGDQKFEVRDFGDVGCYRTRVVVSPDSPPQEWENVCVLVTGGKLMLGLSSDASKPLDFETVRGLLLKTAARRAGKGP